MKIYTLHKTQFLPISIDEAWAFFSSPGNLATITPPELKFVVRSQFGNTSIYSGMRIDYTVSPLLGVPMHWRTEILNVSAPHMFTDRQEKGPYALWEHTHRFMPVAGGVNMTDDVKYALPLGVLGTIAHKLIVKKKLNAIFDFREAKLKELFGD